MTLSRLATVALALGSLALSACKQDIGERCEQGSDCSSGYCDFSTASMMTSAMGRVCTGPPTTTFIDAGLPDAAADAGDVRMYDTGVVPPVGEAGADAPVDHPDAPVAQPDAPADAQSDADAETDVGG
jgi:hypothetical protein